MQSVNWRNTLYGVVCSISVTAMALGAAPSLAVDLVVTPADKGTVFLQNGPNSLEFRWVKTGQADVVQRIIDKIEITGNPTHVCKLWLQPLTAPGVGLMAVTEAAGLTNGYIGIRDFQVCSEISGSEALTFALGGVLEGYQVSHTELNFRMKGKSIARIVTSFKGQLKTFILKTPGSVLPSPPPAGATIIECQYTAGIGAPNQCRFVANDLWESMTITNIIGRFSIDGGGSGGPGSKFSITKLEAVLDCDEHKATLTATDPNGATAVGTRLGNTDEETCNPIPYSLGWDNTDPVHPALVFSKADLGQAVATTFTITWPNAPVPAAGINGVIGAIGVSRQEFVPAEGFKKLDLCVGTPVYELQNPPNGPLVLVRLDGITAAQDLSPSLDGNQYGCVYERRITLPEGGTVGLEELIYLQGDWKALR